MQIKMLQLFETFSTNQRIYKLLLFRQTKRNKTIKPEANCKNPAICAHSCKPHKPSSRPKPTRKSASHCTPTASTASANL